MTTPPSPSPADSRRRLVLIWLILTVTTVVSWQLVPGHAEVTATLSDEFVAAIVVLAAIKCRLITGYFMEVRHAPRWLRVTIDAWLFVLWAGLLGVYLWT